jgi:hypothetical protein
LQEVYLLKTKEEAVSLILRLLNRRLGEISSTLVQQIQELSLEQLETLGEALLDFTSLTDLTTGLYQFSIVVTNI